MKVELDLIEQNENSRVIYKEGDLNELMSSMKKHGLLQPVGLRKLPSGKYDAVFGNRRIIAAKKLGWHEIDATLIKAEDDTERDILNLVENIKRKNTTLAEDGRMFAILKDRGLNESEIATRLDITPQRVRIALDVVKEVPAEFHKHMPNSVQNTKRKGSISPAVTNELLNIKKRHELNRPQFRMLLNAAREGMSVNHVREISPFIKQGGTVAAAIKHANHIQHVAVEVYVNRKEVEAVEKKTGGTISAFLVQILVDKAGLNSLTPRFKGTNAVAKPRNFYLKKAGGGGSVKALRRLRVA